MKLKYCIFAALFAALTFVATAFAQIPLAGAGYVHLGDTFVLLSALVLPLPYALVASALGAALADIAASYVAYAPITAVVKALMVLVMWLLCRNKRDWLHLVAAFVCATLTLGAGYFVYEAFALGMPVALADLPFNLLQGAVCSVPAFVVYKLVGNRLRSAVLADVDDNADDSSQK